MGFWSLKNSHMMFILILGVMIIPIIVHAYYPEYLTYSGYLAIGLIMLLIVGLYLNALIQGPRYPHIEHSIFDSVTGIAYAIKDFYIDREPEPGALVPDVWPVNPDEKGNAKPTFVFGRWWYPYFARTHWGIDVADFEKAFLHFFLLPHPWNQFLGFGRREDAAYLSGEQISHGSSTHLDSILAPFKVDFVGVEIPVYLGVLSTYSIRKMTAGWENGMKELARTLTGMNDFIEENKGQMFPKVQLEDMLKSVFPEVDIPGHIPKPKKDATQS